MANTRVLVVDDNATTLALVCYLLSRRGKYEVLSTTNPKQALEIVKSGPSLDVVISDIEMPELRGPELVMEIRQTSPATGCVLMSACINRPEDLPPDVPFLSKPIDAAQLFSAVRVVISESIRAAANLERTLERTAELRNQAITLQNGLNQTREAVAVTIEEAIQLRNPSGSSSD